MKWQQSCLLHRQGGVEEEEGEEQEGEDWKEGAQVAQKAKGCTIYLQGCASEQWRQQHTKR